MKSTAKIIGICALSALAGCGKYGPLEPRAGAAAPPLAYGQKEAAETDSFLTPSIQTRPGRSDELLRRSEKRRDDPFDLPPGEEPSDTQLPEQSSETPSAPKI
jgi:predicted small lipoprotein YifL